LFDKLSFGTDGLKREEILSLTFFLELSEDSQEEADGMSEDSTSVVLDDFSEVVTAGLELLELTSGEIPLFDFSVLEDFFELSSLEDEEVEEDINYRITFL
jgi:hypothetical protein